MDVTPIGFVGLGNMGQPMVARIAGAGFPVIAYDQSQAARDAVSTQANVSAVADLTEVGAVARIIILMLPDSRVVADVVWGGAPETNAEPGGNALASGVAEGTIIVDMSSSFAPATQALGKALQTCGITLLDAPVSGGVGKAVTGELAIMAGGPSAEIEVARAVLETMGSLHLAGGLGAGHALKALNNYVSAAGLVATSEALVVGERFGLDPERMVDILNASTGRNNTTENKAKRFMLSGAYNSGFAYALMRKDVGMARDLAAELGLDADSLRSVSAQLDDMAERLGSDADHTEVHRDVANRNAGKS